MQKAFVSYSRKDQSFAEKLSEDLRRSGIAVWRDVEEMRVGDSIIGRISDALREVDFVIGILSVDSVASKWVKEELEQAYHMQILGRRVRILPVVVDDCELPHFLQHKVYADFKKPIDYTTALRQLVRSLRDSGAPQKGNTCKPDSDFEVLQRALLPRFVFGQFLHPYDLLRLQQTINILECLSGIRTTRFEPFYFGQLMRPNDLNDLLPPLRTLLTSFGLENTFLLYPVAEGTLVTERLLNELVEKVNAVTSTMIENAKK